jgi:TPP-dependent 2-oxoacid decarboxylase
MAQMSTLATSLLQGLKDHGARELFGIPGDFVLPFFKVIEESGILPHFTLSHEPGVGFAADAAARYHMGLASPSSPSVPERSTWSTRSQAPMPSDRLWL